MHPCCAAWFPLCAGSCCCLTCCSFIPSHRSLAAEGLQFFQRDWRYRSFIACGVIDGLPALLGTARRQHEARLAEDERHRELAERCVRLSGCQL